MADQWGILARRGGGSVFGAAEAFVTQDGVLQVFTSKEEASAKAREWNERLATHNVSYQAVRLYDAPGQAFKTSLATSEEPDPGPEYLPGTSQPPGYSCTRCLEPFLRKDVTKVMVEMYEDSERVRRAHFYCHDCLDWYEDIWGPVP